MPAIAFPIRTIRFLAHHDERRPSLFAVTDHTSFDEPAYFNLSFSAFAIIIRPVLFCFTVSVVERESERPYTVRS